MAKITDQQIMDVIHDNTKSRKDREREAAKMVRQQQREQRHHQFQIEAAKMVQQQREAEDNRNRKHVERITQ